MVESTGLPKGCALVAVNFIPAGTLITEYGGVSRDASEFKRDPSLPPTHAVRLGGHTADHFIDGYGLSKEIEQEIHASGGSRLPASSALYSKGVAAMANAPNTRSGWGGVRADS